MMSFCCRDEKCDGAAPSGKKRRSKKPKVRPGAILLKYFPQYRQCRPECAVSRRARRDGNARRLMLGVPALLGGIPILLKLASTLQCCSWWRLLSRTVERGAGRRHAGALAAISGLVALAASWSPNM